MPMKRDELPGGAGCRAARAAGVAARPLAKAPRAAGVLPKHEAVLASSGVIGAYPCEAEAG